MRSKIVNIIINFIFTIALCGILGNVIAVNVPKDDLKNFTEISQEYGLNAEEFEVITEDGYIITLFHIPGKKKPVLLMHGICDTSSTWVLRGNKSLAITLAQEGYDVWAGNIRGNRYGRKHVSLNPDTDEAFWDFSFHEVGLFDWPAMIDRVLKEASEEKIYAIGHSQGTTSFLILSSLRPEYNNKVELLIGLAPAVFLDHTGPVLTAIARAGPVFLPALKNLGYNEVFADSNSEKKLLELLCSLAENICDVTAPSLIPGYDPEGIEPEFMPLLFRQFPAGASLKTIEHYSQFVLRGKFSQFDYGLLNNLKIYGETTPPEYDLQQVSVNTALLYGENDMLSTVKDVQRLAKLLPNVVYNKAIDKKTWNHIDFVWSREADTYLFGHILKSLQGNS